MMSSHPSTSKCMEEFLPPPVWERFEILQHIFQYCDTGYDSTCTLRLVRREWKASVQQRWKSYKTPQTVFRDNCERQEWQRIEPDEGITLSQFVAQQKGKKKPRYLHRSNLVLRKWAIVKEHFTNPDDVGIDPTLDQVFWTTCAQNVAILTLNKCKIPLVNDQLHAGFQASLPNLERLTIKNCTFMCFDDFYPEGYLRMRSLQRYIYGHPSSPEYNPPPHVFPDVQNSTLGKLKFVHIENVLFGSTQEELRWTSFSVRLVLPFPSLEQVRVEFPGCQSTVSLKTSGRPGENKVFEYGVPRKPNQPEDIWEYYFMSRLRLYSGLPNTTNLMLLNNQYMDQLCFHVPLNSKAPSFPFNVPLENLTKLYIMGNGSKSFDFFRLVPNLRELKWNNLRETFRASYRRLECAERNIWNPVKATDVVPNTTGLAEDFKLGRVQSLELEWQPIALTSWEKLGSWTPRLKVLKCTVMSDEHLRLIGKCWGGLRHMELAHGSQVSIREIRRFLVVCPSLRCFIWKPCPCQRPGNPGESEELGRQAEALCNSLRGKNIILPWKPVQHESRKATKLINIGRLKNYFY